MSYIQDEKMNRSTWLAGLWLENQSLEVWDQAIKLAKENKKQELSRLLVKKTGFIDEENKREDDINWDQVVTCLLEK